MNEVLEDRFTCDSIYIHLKHIHTFPILYSCDQAQSIRTNNPKLCTVLCVGVEEELMQKYMLWCCTVVNVFVYIWYLEVGYECHNHKEDPPQDVPSSIPAKSDMHPF